MLKCIIAFTIVYLVVHFNLDKKLWKFIKAKFHK